MTIPMPARNTLSEVVARAAGKCFRLACARSFPSTALGEVAEVVSGGTPSTERSEFWGGDIVWVTPKDLGRPRAIEIDSSEKKISQVGLARSAARLLPAGTVLLSSRAPIGHVGIASIPLTTNQGFKNIICSSKLLNRFLFHILRGSIDELTAEGHGNTFLEIPAKVVRSFEIPLPPLQIQTAAADLLDALYRRLAGQKEELPTLPPPLAEQQRIVARIEELTAKIQEVKNLRQKATDETNALVGSCFERLLKEAPRQSRWEFGPIPAFAEVNPSRKGKIGLAPSELVSFVPMTAVDDVTGTIARPEMRTFAEVAKGYTWFLDGDVIFARITPCMQNGKAALAKNLMNAVGFGSTEFHVIRPSSKVTGEWLHALVRHKSFRDDAAAHFKGTAGQQRVPQSFLEQRVIPVPPISEQRRIVVYLDDLQAKVDALKKLQTETAAELDAMLPSILDKAFKGEL